MFGALTLEPEQRQTPAFRSWSCLWPFGVSVWLQGRATAFGLQESKSPSTKFRPCTFYRVGYVGSPVVGRPRRFPLSPGHVAGAPLAAVYFSREWSFRAHFPFPPNFTMVEICLKSNSKIQAVGTASSQRRHEWVQNPQVGSREPRFQLLAVS